MTSDDRRFQDTVGQPLTTNPDPVHCPPHYRREGLPECIELIEALGWGDGFCLGNALKYLYRASSKGKELEDLRKARWYLDRYIERVGTKDES